jgi:tRNA(Ser,Leu) C12 N-acetylase TAN1
MELNDWEIGSVSRRLAVEYSLNRKRQIDVMINLETRMAELKERVEQELKPQRTEERNFCSRCGKRTKDSTHIHTCTPPHD